MGRCFCYESQQTQWFSWIQASTPVGIMFGYLLGFIANAMKSSNANNEECLAIALIVGDCHLLRKRF